MKNKEYTFKDEKHRVAGMLLYARTNEEIQPDQTYQMHGNQISVKTLDLNKPFKDISKQLDGIVNGYFNDIQQKNKRCILHSVLFTRDDRGLSQF